MKKRKIVNLIATSTLFLSVIAPNMVVTANSFNKDHSEADQRNIPISDLTNYQSDDREISNILESIYISKITNDDVSIISQLPTNYSIMIPNYNKNQIEANDKNELFFKRLKIKEIYSKQLTLLVFKDKMDVVLELDLTVILNKIYTNNKNNTFTINEPNILNINDKQSRGSLIRDQIIEEPTLEEPTLEEPTVEEPTLEEPTLEEPTVEEPTVEEPTVEEPTVEEPTVEEPTVEKPIIEESENIDLLSEGQLEKYYDNSLKYFEIHRLERTLDNVISVFLENVTRTAENGIYTVKTGDNFWAIANSFALSVKQLEVWNTHILSPDFLKTGDRLAVNKAGVENMLSASDNKRFYRGGATPIFNTRQEFIDQIAPMAIEIANQKGEQNLWASLMIAQAAHESNFGRSALASPPYYNLSGIKGKYNGNSVLMWTWEVFSGENVNIIADFRQFPSYNASLQSYADLLRYGLTSDRNYYSGTWVNNTTSVWDVLNNKGLKGYATDPNYYAAIKRTIDNYNLTKYDKEVIISSKKVSYNAEIKRSGDTISSRPYGTADFKVLTRTNPLIGKEVVVTKEAVTPRSTYVYMTVLGENVSGWVDKNALEVESILSEKNIEFQAEIVRKGDTISSQPYGTDGYKVLARTNSLIGKEVKVTKEAVTPRSTYVYISVTGSNVSGWVDKKALKVLETVLSEKDINYHAEIKRSGDTISSRPYGTASFKVLTRTNSLIGKEVVATKEAVTPRSTYVYMTVLGENVSGWVDKDAIEIENILSQRDTNYHAQIKRSGDTISSRPYGTADFKVLTRTNPLIGKEVVVTKEAVTPRSTYVYMTVLGENVSGWVDKNALEVESILSEKNIEFQAEIVRKGDTISSQPYGTDGYKVLARTNSLIGKEVKVTKEAVTPRSTYVYISVTGSNVSGWVDKKALKIN